MDTILFKVLYLCELVEEGYGEVFPENLNIFDVVDWCRCIAESDDEMNAMIRDYVEMCLNQ